MASKGHADSVAVAADNDELPVNKPVRGTTKKPKQPTANKKGLKRAHLADKRSEVKNTKKRRRSPPKGNDPLGSESRKNIKRAASRHKKSSQMAHGNEEPAPSVPETKESKTLASGEQKGLLPFLFRRPKNQTQYVIRSRSDSQDCNKQKKQEPSLLTIFMTEKRVSKEEKSCSIPGAVKTTPKKSSRLKKKALLKDTAVVKVAKNGKSIAEKTKNGEPLAESVVAVAEKQKKVKDLIAARRKKRKKKVKVSSVGVKLATGEGESVVAEKDAEIQKKVKGRRKQRKKVKDSSVEAELAAGEGESFVAEKDTEIQKKVKGRRKQRKKEVKDLSVEADLAVGEGRRDAADSSVEAELAFGEGGQRAADSSVEAELAAGEGRRDAADSSVEPKLAAGEGRQDAPAPLELFMCKSCGKIFQDEQTFRRHVAYCEASKHVCDLCSKAFKSAAMLKQHFKIHSMDKASTCNVPGKDLNKGDKLNTHMTIRYPVCPFSCGKGFDQWVHFHRQPSVAGASCGREGHICDVCGRKLATAGQLIRHKRAHTQLASAGAELMLPCSFCEKDFKTKQGLRVHERIHTGEKPFICQICPARFVQKSSLTEHLKVHTRYQPYTCHYCGMTFTQETSLKLHVARKHNLGTYLFKRKPHVKKKLGAEWEREPIAKIPQAEAAKPGKGFIVKLLDGTVTEEQGHPNEANTNNVSMVTTEAVVPELVSRFPGQPIPNEIVSTSECSLIAGISVNSKGSGNSDKTDSTYQYIEVEHNYGNVRQQGMVIGQPSIDETDSTYQYIEYEHNYGIEREQGMVTVQPSIANVEETSTGQLSIGHLEQRSVAHIDKLFQSSGHDGQPNDGVSEPNIISEPNGGAVEQPMSASVVQRIIANFEQPNTVCLEPLNSASVGQASVASVEQQVLQALNSPIWYVLSH